MFGGAWLSMMWGRQYVSRVEAGRLAAATRWSPDGPLHAALAPRQRRTARASPPSPCRAPAAPADVQTELGSHPTIVRHQSTKRGC